MPNLHPAEVRKMQRRTHRMLNTSTRSPFALCHELVEFMYNKPTEVWGMILTEVIRSIPRRKQAFQSNARYRREPPATYNKSWIIEPILCAWLVRDAVRASWYSDATPEQEVATAMRAYICPGEDAEDLYLAKLYMAWMVWWLIQYRLNGDWILNRAMTGKPCLRIYLKSEPSRHPWVDPWAQPWLMPTAVDPTKRVA